MNLVVKNERARWETYERMVARLMADQLSTGLCVTPNARILGRFSGRQRQIDILIDARHDTDNTRRIVVDAKQRRRKIDVRDVEAFQGLMEDVDATRGFLVCTSGHTKAAERRAQSTVGICLVPLDHVEDFDPSTWPHCLQAGCNRGRIFWDGYPEILLEFMALDESENPSPIHQSFVHKVGKCDRCGKFHVLCTTCDQVLCLPEGDESDVGRQCACRLPWFWLASVEVDEKGRRSSELHLVLGDDNIVTVDRRSLS